MSDINQKTLQYKQIDFLRLFRLCRERGVVRRKRKMPSQYDRASHVNSSCSKLFKSFLTGVFEDSEVQVDNRRNQYRVMTPSGAAERLNFINGRRTFLTSVDEYRDIIRRLDALSVANDNNGFITGVDAHGYNSFVVASTPSADGRYQAVVSGLTNASNVTRPREEYYRCAKACLDYKARWNEHIGILCSFVDDHRQEIERRMAEQRDQAERERLASLREEERRQEERRRQERQRAAERRQREQAERAERQRQVEEQAQRAHTESRARSQQLFNEALASRRGGAR
ncbi:MAG: hypothetical protein ACWGQW_03755 [bacterium]